MAAKGRYERGGIGVLKMSSAIGIVETSVFSFLNISDYIVISVQSEEPTRNVYNLTIEISN